MSEITIYGSHHCSYCQRAEQLLINKGATKLNKIFVDEAPEQLAQMITKTGRRTVPQIYIDNKHIGGFDDLAALDRAGELSCILNDQKDS